MAQKLLDDVARMAAAVQQKRAAIAANHTKAVVLKEPEMSSLHTSVPATFTEQQKALKEFEVSKLTEEVSALERSITEATRKVRLYE